MAITTNYREFKCETAQLYILKFTLKKVKKTCIVTFLNKYKNASIKV